MHVVGVENGEFFGFHVVELYKNHEKIRKHYSLLQRFFLSTKNKAYQ